MDSAKIISKKNSAKYERLLTQKTEQAKEITKNQYFKFTEEDGVVTFSLRNFLEQLNKTELNRFSSQTSGIVCIFQQPFALIGDF